MFGFFIFGALLQGIDKLLFISYIVFKEVNLTKTTFQEKITFQEWLQVINTIEALNTFRTWEEWKWYSGLNYTRDH